MNEILEQTLLYDFYGELLTEHQKEIYEQFVLEDLSLSEIAEQAGISRQGLDDQPPGGWRPWERLTLPQALAGFTRDAAWAGFAESRFGSLEPGKWADFILVDRDVSTATPHDLARTQVLETWIAGRKVWERASAGAQPAK